MTCGSSGTGINDSFPEVGEREGNGKETFPTLGKGKGIKNHCHNLKTGRERKKSRNGDTLGPVELII